MRIRLTLKAGRPGTKRLVAEYGERLVCVRYRYDERRAVRYKTVELIVESTPWVAGVLGARKGPSDPLEYVHIRMPNLDASTRRALKRLGAFWHPPTQTWRLTYAAAHLLRVTNRIVPSPDDTAPVDRPT